jgi:RsiW-degrading membrane proteinase PrsW (M82 family)
MIVLFLTFGQAFFIEYLVHWKWCKFDISFDSVVKYFACGFLLTTPMAMVFEAIISTVASLVAMFVVIMILGVDADMSNELQSNPKEAMKNFATKYQGIFIVYVFINAFVVAAVVEEMVKYFGYWMVVTPDILPENRSNTAPVTTSYNTNGHEEENTRPLKSARSTGAGITVAMVSVALGFACCENLMYIFVYSPPSLGVGKLCFRSTLSLFILGSFSNYSFNYNAEISTLIARSLFPVHPLCAAIQSIGVCKRDIEGNKRYGVGRIITPAVLLHGSFDFVLMLAAFYESLKLVEEGGDQNEGTDESSNQPTEEDLAAELPSLISGLVFVILGSIYYGCASRAQNQRLISMDSVALDQGSSSLV